MYFFLQRRESHNALLQGQQNNFNKNNNKHSRWQSKNCSIELKIDYFKVKDYLVVSLATFVNHL